ncbi:peptide MFS transporter [Lolliginicoccus suaedae]|uniref:peptide MFS transporter n=1 Tax=Lolliginicoccus suaedae TaxID=2605429 RepID=UPI0011F038F1|nr:peptide MFS transporter [Lolliginicoccus suaedae]
MTTYATPGTGDPAAGSTSFLGHPRGLATVFTIELWERFSFYGMQAILLYYLYYSVADGGLAISFAAATSIVGAYGGFVYLSTILGAWVADRILGAERTLFLSALLIMAGHISLAVLPGLVGLAVGLVLVAVGSGGLKANASVIVGELYARTDPRRDAGFSIFYLGVNLGALVGPLLTGLTQSAWGFHAGFSVAAFGMAIGLAVYWRTRDWLPVSAATVCDPAPAGSAPRIVAALLGAVALVALAGFTGILTLENLSTAVVTVVAVAAVAYFVVILRSPKVTGEERSRVRAFIPLFLANVAFWALFQQQFTVVATFADKRLDREVLGWTFPAAWVQSINPVFIVLLAGVFAYAWTRLGERGPSSPWKLGAGTVLMGVAFLLFLPLAGGGPGSAPLLALIGILLVFTIAELLLSPVGLSLTTRLAPSRFRSQMMALYFLSVAMGSALAGTLARFYDPAREAPYFLSLGLVSIVVGLVTLALVPWIRRASVGVL